jgi:hypothetical protein
MDSAHWKTELFPVADRIEELASFERYSERRANLFEREVMLAIFSVRTLIERHKLSEELLAERMSVSAYPKKTQKPTTWLNNHKIDELFDLDTPRPNALGLGFYCNQIIHSYILVAVQDGHQFSHILFCSDYERNRSLYFAAVSELVAMIRKVAFDYPARMHVEFNPRKQDYDIKNYTRAEPGGPANGSQPSRSEKHRTSSAAGSRR